MYSERLHSCCISHQARRQLNWNGGGGAWIASQAAFITSPKTSLANYWGALPPPLRPSVYGPVSHRLLLQQIDQKSY